MQIFRLYQNKTFKIKVLIISFLPLSFDLSSRILRQKCRFCEAQSKECRTTLEEHPKSIDLVFVQKTCYIRAKEHFCTCCYTADKKNIPDLCGHIRSIAVIGGHRIFLLTEKMQYLGVLYDKSLKIEVITVFGKG